MPDMFDDLKQFKEQCKAGFELGNGIKVRSPKSILVCGMGGSGIVGDFVQELDLIVPVIVNKRPRIPKFVNKDTLVFCVSYSGNTWETINCFKESKKAKAKIIAITSNGKLKSLASKSRIETVLVPKGELPRVSLGHLFFSILRILQNSGLIDVSREMKRIEKISFNQVNRSAKKLSKKLFNEIPLIYSNSDAVAYRWKTQFNENSKVMALAESIPEIFHNEVESYDFKLMRFYHPVILSFDYQINPRFRKILKIKKVDYDIYRFKNTLSDKMRAVWLGDITSYYLSKLYKKDPVSVNIIEWIKGNIRYLP